MEDKQDVKLQPDARGLYDFVLNEDGTGFEYVNGFETAITVALFTDARAASSIVPNAQDRRGWIGNIFTAHIPRQIGTIAWAYEQARLTQNTVNALRLAVMDAFSSWITNRIVIDYNVDVVKDDTTGAIYINVGFTTSDNKIQKYSILWRNTEAGVIL